MPLTVELMAGSVAPTGLAAEDTLTVTVFGVTMTLAVVRISLSG
jgi:hypothetical protein